MFRLKTPVKKSLLLLTLATLFSGCHSFGPDELRGTHPLYNAAIVDSQNAQLIQNIVRLHYRDPASFLDVSSVTASLKMDLSAGLDQSAFDLQSGGADILQFSAGGMYSTTPTIAYTPLQGEAFVKSILKPIAVEDIFTLAGSGWSSRRLFSLCVERINDLENAPSASGPTPKKPPKHGDTFKRLTQLFETVRSENLIMPRRNPKTNEFELEIKSSPEFYSEVQEIKQLLGLNPRLEIYHLSNDFLEHKSDTIAIRTRSLMSIFFYLSHHVDTPTAHKTEGLVTVTRNQDGSEFDWGNTAAGSVFHVRQQDTHPDKAFVAIPYRGQWFYVADNDLESKSSFMLLTQLFRLQAGASKSEGPVLTLPVH